MRLQHIALIITALLLLALSSGYAQERRQVPPQETPVAGVEVIPSGCHKLQPIPDPDAGEPADTVDQQTWVCGGFEVLPDTLVQLNLRYFVPPLVECMEEAGFGHEVFPEYLEDLRVVLVQEIVGIPTYPGWMVFGYYDMWTNTIYIRTYMPSHIEPESVFLHELIHALTHQGEHDHLPYKQCAGI